MKNNKFLEKYTSKLSKIYIEIHNFNFRHGVAEGDDRSFIGRDEIRNRLRAIFTHSDGKSGTYLITGQRGVGKTSLINKVLAELSGQYNTNFWKHFLQYLTLFAIMVFISFLDKYVRYDIIVYNNQIETYKDILLGILLVVFVLSLFYIGFHSLYRKRQKYLKKNLPSFLHFIWSVFHCSTLEFFVMYKDKTSETKLTKCIKYIAIISLIMTIGIDVANYIYFTLFYILISLIVYIVSDLQAIFTGSRSKEDERLCKIYRTIVKRESRFKKIMPYLAPIFYTFAGGLSIYILILLFKGLSWCLFILIIVASIISIPSGVRYILNKKKKENIFYVTLELLTRKMQKHRSMKQFFDRTKYICIKINLGYDNLRNLDVLKLVAHNVDREYRNFLKTGYIYWTRQILLFASCFFISFMVYELVNPPLSSLLFSSEKGMPHELSIYKEDINHLTNGMKINAFPPSDTIITSNLKRIESVIKQDSTDRNTELKKYRIGIIKDAANKITSQVSYIQNPDTAIYIKMKMAEISEGMDIAANLSRAFEIRTDIENKIKYPLSITARLISKIFNSAERDTIKYYREGDSLKYNKTKNTHFAKRDSGEYYKKIKDEIRAEIFPQKNVARQNTIKTTEESDNETETHPNSNANKEITIEIKKNNTFTSQVYSMFFSPTFLLTFFVLFFVLRYLFTHKQRRILKHLKSMEESIAADILKEEALEASTTGNKVPVVLGYKGRKEKKYPRSDVHDIEKQLISILKEIATIHKIVHPQFIVVFDELDKIEPNNTDNMENHKTNSYLPHNTRNRQQAVFGLLSGLKYFLTTAQAKFVFVAGREIYEASLADVADRSYYVGSIFNDVINVPSFISDFSDNKKSDICSMTEQYVCLHLFPRDYIVEEYTLLEYQSYLEDNDKISATNIKKEDRDEYKKQQEIIRRKTITLLDNFILYLTHVGKGAPKKMISLFEQFVERRKPYAFTERTQNDNSIEYQKIRANTLYYLVFDFYQQYSINLIACLINPVIQRFNSTNQQEHGDKLLISSLFFLDHLYKFHHHPFSWRALESSPELIDINKTPELRVRIKDMLHYLSQNHIKHVDNGLYHFRFYKKIAHEIAFLTRVSEEGSAIYNFTLDESYNVKQYYRLMLTEIRQQYKEEGIKTENTVNTFSTLHFTLGELYLYDEEIEEAIVEFNSTISILIAIKPQDMTAEQLIILVKAMLCLGISYEKKNLNAQAFLVYSEIVKILISSRDIKINRLGLITKEVHGQMKVKHSSNKKNKNEEPGIFFKKVETWEHLTRLLDGVNYLHPEIHKIINRITSYEGLRIFYLPLLAKFQILEKSQVGGIRPVDIKRLVKEFFFLTNMVNKDNYGIMYADFYNRLGDILYYKNSRFVKEMDGFTVFFPYDFATKSTDKNPAESDSYGETQQTSRMKCISNCGHCKNMKESEKILEKNTPCDACHFYKYAILLLLNEPDKSTTEDVDIKNWLHHITDKLIYLKAKDNFQGWDDMRFNLLARILSNLGDCMISCMTLGEKTEEFNSYKDFLNAYIQCKPEKDKKKMTSTDLEKIKTACDQTFAEENIVIISGLYLLSSLYYRKATSYTMAGQQHVKILHILKHLTNARLAIGETPAYTEVKLINEHFSYHAIKGISNSYKDVHFVETRQLEHLFKTTVPSYRNLLLSNDTFEIILFYSETRYRLQSNIQTHTKRLYSFPQIDRMFNGMNYALNSSIHNRIMFLSFKSKINKEEFYQLWFTEITLTPNNFDTELVKRIEYFITDSIFNLREITKFATMYGETFLLTNIFIADTYKELMYWCEFKDLYENLLSNLNLECTAKDCKFIQTNKRATCILQLLRNHYIRKIIDIEKRWHPVKEKQIIAESTRTIIKDRINSIKAGRDKNKENLKEELGKAIGEEAYIYLSTDQEQANAQRSYHKAREMHTEGRTYKNMIERGCYLNDEYNDRKFHFLTAVECYKVNNYFDDYRANMKIRNENYTIPKMYDPDRYLYLDNNGIVRE